MSGEGRYFCSQNTFRLGEFARWPGVAPRLPWHIDLAGFSGNLAAASVLEAFRLAWLWWAEAAEFTPVLAQSPAEALIRSHFAKIDGPSQILAWSELADNTNQPKTQRYDSGERWVLSESLASGMDLARVACHEIGHVLGLEHDGQNSGSLMAPFISEGVRKPTARDIQRLLSLGYAKRTTPLPGPDDPGPGVPENHIRLKTAVKTGQTGSFTAGSDMTAGDWLCLLGGDGPPPPIP